MQIKNCNKIIVLDREDFEQLLRGDIIELEVDGLTLLLKSSCLDLSLLSDSILEKPNDAQILREVLIGVGKKLVNGKGSTILKGTDSRSTMVHGTLTETKPEKPSSTILLTKNRKKFLEWIEKHREECRSLCLGDIGQKVLGRELSGQERKWLRTILEERGIEFRKVRRGRKRGSYNSKNKRKIREVVKELGDEVKNLSKAQILEKCGLPSHGRYYIYLNEILDELNLKARDGRKKREEAIELTVKEGHVLFCPLGQSVSLAWCREKCRGFVSANVDEDGNGTMECRGNSIFGIQAKPEEAVT